MSTCGTCSRKGRCQDYVMYDEYCQAWVADEATTLRSKNERLLEALHDAIDRPKGVVPDSAIEFYKPDLKPRG
jgi:hypothetical protein